VSSARSVACYTTGRYVAGRVWLGERVAARLVRDAAALGLGALDPREVLARLVALGEAAFGGGAGVVRLEARPGGLVGTTRPLGPEPETWRGIVARTLHPGPGSAPGAKRSEVAPLAAARAEAQAAGVDEALLFDASGRLVEGARTNLALVLADGSWVTPPAAAGAVRGVALEAALAAGVRLAERELARADCAAARELVATNAVRGARAVLALDGATVGDGRPGPLAAALAAALAPG
jgi:branched-subunit amino acid aminotransferase/4-amino-4-deoxychorismate lyase